MTGGADIAARHQIHIPTSLAALTGALAAAAALGTTELVSGIEAGTPGAIASVGRQVIELAPGGLERWAIDTFGTGDKPALLASIVVVCLALGAALGVAGRRSLLPAVAGFGAFGLVGALAALDDPLVPGWLAILGPAFAAIVGGTHVVIGMRLLQGRADVGAPSDDADREEAAPASIVVESPTDPRSTRRAFFAYAGGAGAFALTASVAGRALRGRSNAEAARELVMLPEGSGRLTAPSDPRFEGINGLTPHLTPTDDFYLIDTALVKPQVDPATWNLTIEGMVDTVRTYTLDDLLAMDLVDEEITMACVSNEVGGDLIGNAVWTGVPLLDLLEEAGIQPGAEQVAGRSVDGWTCGFPVEALRDGRPALLVVGMNGEPLPIRHGFPARVVVGGLYGYVSGTKWVETLTLTTWDGFDGYWIPRGWSKEGPIKVQCRIDVPGGQTIAPGPTPIAGVAWAQPTGVGRVEVQVDDGDWVEARLAEQGNDVTWRQWVLEWDATPGSHLIRARATDLDGMTQTADLARPAPSGATGYPTRRVQVAGA
jgi:DMSO/TMAO reductase YedYZ molybdopterin-dependent catalytic subunit